MAKALTPDTRPFQALLGLWALCWILTAPVWAADESQPDIDSFQSLGASEIKAPTRVDSAVTSVGKKVQRASETAAAIFVITPDDIRRSGVTSIADALRLAPGLQVARVSSNRWAISARGFNGAFSNKLLVLIDGREVYSPSFGGVYWDVQDTPLEDIERIEVIRGPGASLWGANAVNGVINIITRAAQETQGGSLRAGGGSLEQGYGSLRYGGRLGNDTYGRVYAKGTRRGSFDLRGGGNADDRWSMVQTGFRIDRDGGTGKTLLLEGGAYESDYRQLVLHPTSVAPYNIYTQQPSRASGFNLLGRWRQALSMGSELSLQGYYDHSYRFDGYITQERDTFDLEFQHRWFWGSRQDIVWGLGYRLLKDRLTWEINGGSVVPGTVNRQLFNAFLQDDISLIRNRLTLTLGAKLQHNDYTGFEGQPSARLFWNISPQQSAWAAISRAVRIPNRAECCVNALNAAVPPGTEVKGVTTPLPVEFSTLGNRKFQSEKLWAYEVGYRIKPRDNISIEATAFYNRYTSLRSWDLIDVQTEARPTSLIARFPFGNKLSADSYGTELNMEWRPFREWSLQAAYSYLQFNFNASPTVFVADSGTYPQQQAFLRSSLTPSPDWDFDLWLRYVDRLPLGDLMLPTYLDPIPAYLSLDARLAWRPIKGLELSAVGQNLLQPSHAEFAQESFGPPQTVVPRGFFLQLDWRF